MTRDLNNKEEEVKSWLLIVLCAVFLTGCESINKAGRATGSVIGETTNVVGSVTEGGAEAVQGKTTSKENPYGR